MCLLEPPNPVFGVPILQAEVFSNIVGAQQAKSIATYSMSMNLHNTNLHVLQEGSHQVLLAGIKRMS
jgi:hypothetical protein